VRAKWIAAATLVAGLAAQSAGAEPSRPPGFASCVACHKVKAGERAGIGPNLWGIAGKPAGSGEFNYSPALKSSRIVWNKANLTAFIMNPRQVVPNNRMPFAGLKDKKTAEAVSDYLLKLR